MIVYGLSVVGVFSVIIMIFCNLLKIIILFAVIKKKKRKDFNNNAYYVIFGIIST